MTRRKSDVSATALSAGGDVTLRGTDRSFFARITTTFLFQQLYRL